MTQKRRDDKSTPYGLWLREQKDIDSGLGYIATNIDYIWQNYKTGQWMIKEEKCRNSEPAFYQKRIFKMLDNLCRRDPNYFGAHLIQFENTTPEDGEIRINGVRVSKEFLLEFLQFKQKAHDIISARSIPWF
jgi:hypothetical protein